MSAITLDSMKENLIPVDQVFESLQRFEPLSSFQFDDTAKISFELEPLKEGAGPTDLTDSFMTVNDTEYRLTTESLYQATSSVGLSQAYVKKTPANLIQSHLNYWFSTSHREELRPLIISNDTVGGFSKPTREPYSNVDLLTQAVEGINHRYGDVELFADYKFNNSLAQTDVRLIIPTTALQVADTGMIDIPAGQDDEWSLGIHLHNSLLGHSQTSMDAYLFRWWCTNGATTQVNTAWSRRSGDSSEIYEWARDSVDSILGHAEDLFTALGALANTNIEGNVSEILLSIFTEFKISPRHRSAIMEELLSYSPLTMYHVMQAITRIANVPENAAVADRLMRIGGTITRYTYDSKNAKIWNEGRTASEDETNPYELVIGQ